MPSEAQLSANRRNAKLSTGPRTSAGRARSAMNACKSGIYAKSEIIPGEDPAELEALKARIYDSLQPSPEEALLADQLIGADWQFRRLRRAEADMWNSSIKGDMEKNQKKGLPEDHDIYLRAIYDNKDFFDRIYRYQASTARILNRSLETLLRIRKLDLLQPKDRNELNSLLVESDETNPIPEVPVPSLQSPVPDSAETNPIPKPQAAEPQPIPDPRPSLAPGSRPPAPASEASRPPSPVSHPRYRYYNGQRVPITEIPQS